MGISGLITAGRCFSVDTYALGAVRMNRDMYRMGECIGVAAAMAIKDGTDILSIDYDEYRAKVEARGCYNGYPGRTVGFDNNRIPDFYKAVTFEFVKTFELLKTETPGAAVWSCFTERDLAGRKDAVAHLMEEAEDELTRYNAAIALGVMGDERALPVLREIVINRDWYYFKDCRRSNQHRSAVAICLLGRLGKEEDARLLDEIVFDPAEIDKPLYHVLKPEYIHHCEKDRNFLFFDIFTHAVMSTVKIYKRNGLDTAALKARLEDLFANEETVRRITWARSDEPAYIEIKTFFRGVLAEI
jgi:hypothetical protein